MDNCFATPATSVSYVWVKVKQCPPEIPYNCINLADDYAVRSWPPVMHHAMLLQNTNWTDTDLLGSCADYRDRQPIAYI